MPVIEYEKKTQDRRRDPVYDSAKHILFLSLSLSLFPYTCMYICIFCTLIHIGNRKRLAMGKLRKSCGTFITYFVCLVTYRAKNSAL